MSDYHARLSCAAHGCPLPGGLLDGGNWLCRHHYGHPYQFWPKITGSLKEHEALLGLVQRTLSETAMGRDGHRLKDGEALEKLAAWTKDRYPDLQPLTGESPKTWAYRADGWLAKRALKAAGFSFLKK